MSTVDSDIKDTLALVNAARQAFGKPMLAELPDSKPGDAADCLYYRALADLGVTQVGDGGQISFDEPRKASYIAAIWGTSCDGQTVQAPGQFSRVIHRFDTNEVPHYNTTAPKHF